MFTAALLIIAKISPKYTQNWQSWRGEVGVLQTARLEVEFGREDYTIVQVQSQRVAELFFLQKKKKKKARCLPLTSGISRLKSQWWEERRYPEVAWSYPGLISAGTPPSGRSRHLAESSESDSEAGKAAVQRTVKISGTVSSRLSEKKLSMCF